MYSDAEEVQNLFNLIKDSPHPRMHPSVALMAEAKTDKLSYFGAAIHMKNDRESRFKSVAALNEYSAHTRQEKYA